MMQCVTPDDPDGQAIAPPDASGVDDAALADDRPSPDGEGDADVAALVAAGLDDSGVDDPPPADVWAAEVLGLAPPTDGSGSWLDGRVASRVLPAHERSSVLRALAEPPDLIEHIAFARNERTRVRTEEVTVGLDATEDVPESGTMVAWRNGGVPVISWLEIDGEAGALRLVCVCAEREEGDAALDALVSVVEGPASVWRGQVVVYDPAAEALLVHLAPEADDAGGLDDDLLVELDRDLVVPIRCWDELRTTVPRRAVLLHGPPGTGKRRAVRHVLGQLDGVTRIVASPRCLLHGDLVRAVFDLAADVAPALVVLEDLDVVVGDWGASPAPEGLVELVAQLDGPAAPGGVFTLATTNYGQSVDVSFGRRTGRFDRLIEVGPPSSAARRQVLEVIVARAEGGGDPARLGRLVARTDGWTLAQLHELERLAALEAARTREPCDLMAAIELVRDQTHRHAPLAGPGERQAGSYL